MSIELDLIKQLKPVGSKIVVHVQDWHGTAGHVPFLYNLNGTYVPYNSGDPNIIAAQIAKMKAAAIDAINIDWYGAKFNPTELDTDLALLTACEGAGLGYSLCVDQGAIPSGSVATDEYIELLNFAIGEFASSPVYLRDAQNRPIFNFFGEPAGVDWNAVAASLVTPCCFLFEGNQWTHLQAGGCFGWVNPVAGQPQNMDLTSVQAFAAGAAGNPAMMAWYPVYAGFDDCLITPPQDPTGWGSNRVISRYRGRTLMQTFAQVPKGAQWIIVPTWNDWEEGSGVEDTPMVVS